MEQIFTNYFGSLTAIFIAVLYIAIALPLAYRKIGRNNFYGFRLMYTMQDDDIWYEVNEMLGKHMTAQGIVCGIMGLASLPFTSAIAQGAVLGAAMFVMFAGIIYSLVKGVKRMNVMAVEKGLKK